MVMVWLDGGQGEVRGACAPPPPQHHHPKSPHLDPPPPKPTPPSTPLPEPPPPLGGLRPISTGGGVACKSEETSPPWRAPKTSPKFSLPPRELGGNEPNYGGALSAVRAQCNYLGVWPY